MAVKTTAFENVRARPTVDYLLRTTQQNHVQFSMMADLKANILIGASFLMLTLIFGQLQSNGISAEMLTLGVFTLAAAVAAILAVRPTRSRLRPDAAHFNTLFFSSIATADEESYMQRLGELLEDDASIYAAIARDLHQHSQVLARVKYRWLRISYGIFLAGWAATAGVALVSHWPFGTVW